MIETKFKNSEVGMIPVDWENNEVGRIANLIQTGPFGSQLHQSDYITVGIPVVMPKDLVEGKISDTSIARVSKENVERLKRHKIKEGDFLFARRGDVGRCALISKKEVGWLCGTGCFRVSIDKKKCDINYLYYQLQRKETVEWIVSKAIGSTMLNLNTSILSQIPFIQPESIAEQSRIATALSDIDDIIATTKKLIEKKRNIKEGAMQELLSGKRRLPGFKEKWVEGHVSENVVFYKGTGLSKGKLIPNGKYPCILYGEIFTMYNYEVTQCVSHTNIYEGTPSVKGDVLMPASTTTKGIDLAKAICLYEDDVLLGGDIIIMRNDFGKFYPLFFSYYITEIMPKQVEEVAQGTTIIHLQPSKVGKLSIRIPTDLKEQKAIADVLSDMESEIQVLEKRLVKYQSLKLGMMQQLLTGKIRLI